MPWEQAWADHAQHVRLHESHAACPRRSSAGRWRCSRKVLPRHLEIIYEINARFLDEVRIRFPATRSGSRACRSSTRRASATCAWRTWPASAAMRSTASRSCTRSSCKRDVLRGLPRAVAGEVQQQDQRRHAAALAGARQSAARDDAHHAKRSARDGSRISSSCAGSSRSPTTPPSASEWRAIKRANKREFAAFVTRPHRRRRRPGLDVRRAGQAHPRVQAPAPERAARRSRCITASSPIRRRRLRRRAPSFSAARRRPATSWRSSSSS